MEDNVETTLRNFTFMHSKENTFLNSIANKITLSWARYSETEAFRLSLAIANRTRFMNPNT